MSGKEKKSWLQRESSQESAAPERIGAEVEKSETPKIAAKFGNYHPDFINKAAQDLMRGDMTVLKESSPVFTNYLILASLMQLHERLRNLE